MENHKLWVIMVLIVLASCRDKPSAIDNHEVSKMNKSPAETRQNESRRCEAKNYQYPADEKEDIVDERCYRLQEQLHNAVLGGNLVKMKEALMNGANPNGTYYQSYPALQVAAMRGQGQAVALLLSNGASVNQEAPFEKTSLNTAAAAGYLDIVKILIEKGANVCFKTSDGTAADIARNMGHKEIEKFLKAIIAQKCK